MKQVVAIIAVLFLFSCTNKKAHFPKPIPAADNSCVYKSNTVISYSNTVSPLLMSKCMPCHSSPSNFAFDNYTSVKASALSGDLTHAVINDSNFVIMPPPGYGYTALDSCQIKALNLWLAQGCQNN